MKEKSPYYIHSSGGLLSTQFIDKLRQKDVQEKYAKANTFSIKSEASPIPAELEKKITEAWKKLLDKWYSVSISIKKFDISTARRRWIIPLLEALDYKPIYLHKDTLVCDEKDVKLTLSHRGGDWKHAPIIHTVAPNQGLDERITKGRGGKSSHDSLQIYLNETKEDLWGIVTNGTVLRILRDYYHTYTKGYIEFDLEGIFEERNYSDFLALYRLAHPSRFIPDDEGIPPLEHFYKISLAAGEKIGNDLRENVKAAIETLGNGFLTKEFIEKMIEDPEECQAYYQEILHVIYRIIFLMFAEQRDMLPTRDSIYAEAYSMTKLRERAEKVKRRDRHKDIWKGLLVTFDIIKTGVADAKISVFGYNGSLFDKEKIERLRHLNCENTNVLKAIRYLTYFESEKTLQRISYVDLGVEEIGSVYESLLDYTPRVLDEDVAIDEKTYTAKTFFLDPRGAARKSTGSYYTDPRLVNELIKSALKPVLEDRLSSKNSIEEKEKALLSIKVCDPACGSAAFLIAATNFLGMELGKIRTDTEYPPDEEERKARRDVLQHCIYAVDKNPMAVELAKVSLWINACVKDKPLNFLDLRIKCGDSLIGTTPELMRNGIPTEAYSLSGLKGDRKNLVKEIRTKNKSELKGGRRIDETSWELKARKERILREFKDIIEMSEKDPEEVEKKRKEFKKFIESEEYISEKVLANAWTAVFFWPIEEIENENDALTQVNFQNLKDYGFKAIKDKKIGIINNLYDKYRFFHWHLEFPDVFSGENPGFDCILGNPPFLGGLKIGKILGEKYKRFLTNKFELLKGQADLCSIFYRQSFIHINENGRLGMVAVNTISQGDSRKSGLAYILKSGGNINFAHRFIKWPGLANVEVNLISIIKGFKDPFCILDEIQVTFISSRLDNLPESEPRILKQNNNIAFQGSILRGTGFVLDFEEAQRFLNKSKKNSDCLLPHLTGDDLNSDPNQQSSRYVICFYDWSLEKARQYPDLLEIVEKRVKPERQKIKETREKEKWWLFARYRKELNDAISIYNRVLVRSKVSDLHSITFVPKGINYDQGLIIFAYDDDYYFSLLQSNIHELWVRQYSATLRTDIQYNPSACFDTFPLPQNPPKDTYKLANNIGRTYYEYRKHTLITRNIGLTSLYNLYHNPECFDNDISQLRKLHCDMDSIILACYCWEDIDLEHDFYKNDRGQIRFTISPKAKIEILNRLLKLNIEIAEKEFRGNHEPI